MTTLDQLAKGQKARVEMVSGHPGVVQRLYELGLLEGDELEVVRFAPLGDPIEIRVANTRLKPPPGRGRRRPRHAGITAHAPHVRHRRDRRQPEHG